ncbi:YebC-like protein [Periconia macrospinosa]|uniref:YebC-like protein n=1 Tax=Periconia macrospinosa TaxID=97972 RepID=A0A2V1DQ95_9PLEO|nr:YebC-like protein [Periconia macrospinosa]
MVTPLRRLYSSSSSLFNFGACTCRSPRPLERGARCFGSSSAAWSGHSKWATIKHDKGKADAAKSKQRALLTKDISNAVRLGGPDPTMNARLALVIATAKKNAVPKASIEAAIARGRGLSTTGAALETVTLEAILPPAIAVIIEAQTESKNRTLADLRLLVKEAGGNVTPVGYMFEKKGRIRFEKKEGAGVDDILEPALDAGALDVLEDEEGHVVVYTDPAQTVATGEALAREAGFDMAESDIIFDPNHDTLVALDDEAAARDLGKFLDLLADVSGLQGVYLNWSKGAINEDLWAELQSKTGV